MFFDMKRKTFITERRKIETWYIQIFRKETRMNETKIEFLELFANENFSLND